MESTSLKPINRIPREVLHRLQPVAVGDLIRLGNKSDGGYVLPRSTVLTADALLSFGLGNDWSFEREVANLNKELIIHAYDHTVGDRKLMQAVVSSWERPQTALIEIRAWVELYSAYRNFFRGNYTHYVERVWHRREGAEDATLEAILVRLKGCQRVILKMDIEGAEYCLIDELIEHRTRFDLMVIEFHATEFLREQFLEKVGHICCHYEIVHLHGNNCLGVGPDGLPALLEITFLRKDLCTSSVHRERLPLDGLDFPNDCRKADYEFRFDAPLLPE